MEGYSFVDFPSSLEGSNEGARNKNVRNGKLLKRHTGLNSREFWGVTGRKAETTGRVQNSENLLNKGYRTEVLGWKML